MKTINHRMLALLAVLALVIAACSSNGAADTTQAAPSTTAAGPTTTQAKTDTTGGATDTTAAAANPIKIAIVAPSASNDLAFTQSMVDAVNLIAAERGNVEIAISDGQFVVDDAAAAIRGYAEDGYDLVIAHGSQYGGSLAEIAPDFPDTSFAWGTAADTFDQPNIFAYEAASEEGGYVMGIMGAALSKSGVIGIIGPVEVGDAKLYVDGYAAGAKAEDPDATVNINYTGSFSDVALASAAATAQIAAGADVLTGSAQMVVGAVGVAKDEGVLWFGTQANQTALAPSVVVASQVYHWEVVLREILSEMDAGTLGGEIYKIDLANDGLVIENNDGFDLPADVQAKADAATAGIIDGSVTIDMGS